MKKDRMKGKKEGRKKKERERRKERKKERKNGRKKEGKKERHVIFQSRLPCGCHAWWLRQHRNNVAKEVTRVRCL